MGGVVKEAVSNALLKRSSEEWPFETWREIVKRWDGFPAVQKFSQV